MKSWLIASTLVVGLVLFAGVSHAGPLMGWTRTVDIAFTGYCDGLHLVINPTTGVVTGNMTGCDSGAVFGIVSSLISTNYKGGGAAVVIRDTQFQTQKVIRDNGTWTYYGDDGGVVSSGTWTKGTPAAEARLIDGSTSSNTP
jgi:hypothetical protein